MKSDSTAAVALTNVRSLVSRPNHDISVTVDHRRARLRDLVLGRQPGEKGDGAPGSG